MKTIAVTAVVQLTVKVRDDHVEEDVATALRRWKTCGPYAVNSHRTDPGVSKAEVTATKMFRWQESKLTSTSIDESSPSDSEGK